MRKNILKNYGLKGALVAALGVCGMQHIEAKELQEILRYSLVSDPVLLEAKATENAAKSTTKATRARHFPVLALTGTQMLAQKHKNDSDDVESGFGVRGSLNLYSWGGINAAVRRDKHKETYQHHKYFETQEQLGNEIGKLYISALRAKESLLVNQQSLMRHNNLLKDLGIVVKYDSGRRSELVEAQARQLQVKTRIAELSRTMELSLSRLSKYTGKRLTAKDLEDPFRGYSAEALIEKFKNYNNKSLNPSYLAQQAERNSVHADLDVVKAERLPAINLEGSVTRDRKELYLNMSWNVLDMAARHNVERNAQALIAAESKSEQILRDVEEKARTSEIDMLQSEQRAEITAQHISAQKEVVKNYELQFKIARRTLTDVLGAYNELSGIEQENITARNDFRDAALEYLVSQSQVARWAGIAPRKD
ncbi:TolC family protein [Neisseria weaveri]|uniref:Outer membrane channel protein n=1 Tax=Neisseria weaveri TaxID=28091 RepID=A0A3S4ZEB0_9NEIS|nr:TolC family protein [Neisseria weaveri]EGV35453.1 putative outer membrane efflux protein [Neisseria weaveri ATCC 51223]EGV37799.1 putative outer membrane efflux protein [Neisseria weaveri LMG 5135]SAY50422.1 outer membrane channel protein [Neisseria weaveri]VEJ51831.1 outer membrane channel protein [Neisseria weaveri]